MSTTIARLTDRCSGDRSAGDLTHDGRRLLQRLRGSPVATASELAHGAFVLFAESGRVRLGGVPDPIRPDTAGRARVLADVGAGLVFVPSRSPRGEVLRLDVAVPLAGGEGVDRFLIHSGSTLRF